MQKITRIMRWRGLLFPLLLIHMQGGSASINQYDQAIIHPPIPLLEDSGDHVLNSGKAYSPRMTCGTGSGCHDYEKITHAYHFEMGRDEAKDDYGKNRGLPQLVSPGYFGGYSCMGGSRPNILSKKSNATENEFMDYGAPGFVKGCTSCHMGGGFMEKDRDGIRYDEKNDADIPFLDGDYFTWVSDGDGGEHSGHGGGDGGEETLQLWDWKKTGVVEGDCMMCHADLATLKKFPASGAAMGANDGSDGSDSAFDFWKELRNNQLISHDFFREGGTAMWEYVDIKPDTAEGMQLVSFERTFKEGKEGSKSGYSLGLGEDGKPIMHWNEEAFDENGKALIPMLRFPANENCMMCHRTSNSRRGFYGFGGVAAPEIDDNGIIEEDYQDDVHKGKTWVADNGEVRAIENCNTCHSHNYSKPPFANVDLDQHHNFKKGNSDMDVRNDLDFQPNATSCEFCHQQSKTPIIPSGQATLLEAHRELWKLNGDMAGYEKTQLTKITRTHFDVIGCQSCHITGKKSRGKTLQIMYRYRQGEDGVAKIIPYNPKIRTFWKDINSDRVLARRENDAVYVVKTAADDSQFGAIVDPVTGEEYGQVSFSMGRHGPSYGAPESYEAFVGLKKAYDSLMQSKGYVNADMRQYLIESNQYLMTHNVRPSSSSVPCADCHTRKQSGAFSSLVSETGILGTGVEKTVATLIDKRLYDEGLVVMGMDYLQVDDQGVVTENVGDILYSTKIDAFMTYLKNSSATVYEAEFRRTTLSNALEEINFGSGELRRNLEDSLGEAPVYLFKNYQGVPSLKNTAVVGFASGLNDLLLPTYRVEASVLDNIPGSIVNIVESHAGGVLSTSIHRFIATDQNRNDVSELFGQVFVKVPYRGPATDINQVRVVYSKDGGSLHTLDSEDVHVLSPHNEQNDGYIIFATDSFGYFAAVDMN